MDTRATTGAGARLGRAARRLWFPLAVVLLYVYNFPYFAGINSANELPRIYLSMAMVDRAAFNIDPEIARFSDTPDTSSFRGKRYSNKAPGMSVLTAPVYWVQKLAGGGRPPELARMFFWFRLCGATLPSLLFLLLLWRFLRELVVEENARRVVLAAYALGTMALTYGTLLIAHQLSSLLVAASFILIFLHRRGHGGPGRLFLAGLAAASGVFVDYQVAFIGPPLFGYLLWAAWARARDGAGGGRRLAVAARAALIFGAGCAAPFAALLYYQSACFGSPFKTGYHYLTNPVFSQWHSQGFLGLSTFRLASLAGRHFSADDGLFYYSPFLLLAAPGLALMLRRRELRAEGIFCGVVILFFVYFASSVAFVSGWDVGPRYVTCALPYYLAPVAVCVAALGARWWARAPAYGLVALSVLLYVTIQAVFPHYPDNFSVPWFDVTLRFGRAGYVCYNLGWLLGLRGLASALPYLGLAGGLLAALLLGEPQRLARRAGVALAAVALAFSILVFYHAQLSHRRLPVPDARFLSWMDSIWEPRHPGLSVRRLIPAGDRRTGGLRTLER